MMFEDLVSGVYRLLSENVRFTPTNTRPPGVELTPMVGNGRSATVALRFAIPSGLVLSTYIDT